MTDESTGHDDGDSSPQLDPLLRGVGASSLPFLLADCLPCEFWVMNHDGRYVLQSAASRRAWGNLVGRGLDSVEAPARDLDRWAENDRLALQGESILSRYAREIDGQKRHFVTVLSPVKADREVIGIVGMNLDESIPSAFLPFDSDSALSRAELGDFAHDLINVLGSISGFADLAAETCSGPEAAPHLHMIETQSTRGIELARRLIGSERGAGGSGSVDLGDCATRFIDRSRTHLPAGIELSLSLDSGAIVAADSRSIEQILSNLLYGAIGETPHRPASLELSVSGPSEAPGAASGMAMLHVQINSRDDESDAPPPTFAPFNSAKSRGTGHGLWNVRHVVDALGGSLRLRARPGLGTHYEVLLPIAPVS